MVEKKYIYTYKTTNIVNGKYYIGVRCTNNLDDGYIGCGITSDNVAKSRVKRGIKGLCEAVVKYGYDKFEKEILEFFNSEEDAYRKESLLVNENILKDSNSYNISLGGKNSKVPSKFKKYKRIWESLYNVGYSMSVIGKWYGTTHGTVRLIISRDLINKKDRLRGIKKDAKKRCKKIKCLETGEIFESEKDCGIAMFGKRCSGINMVANGKKDNFKGYTFKFI